MQLVLWLGVCFVLVFVAGNRTWIPIVLAAVLWFTVPWIASDLFTGVTDGSNRGVLPNMHPGSWLVLMTFLLRFGWGDRQVGRALRTRRGAFGVIAAFVGLSVVTTVAQGGTRGLPSIVYLIVVPVMYAILVVAEEGTGSGGNGRLSGALIAIAALQAVLSVSQRWLGGPFFFEEYYERYSWWSEDLERGLGTTDHPLMASFLFCVAIPLTSRVKSVPLRVGLGSLSLAGIAATGSRTGLVVGAAAFVWLIVATRMGEVAKVVVVLGAVGLVIGAFSDFGGLGVLDRFQDDSGSTRVRVLAYQQFLDSWSDHLIVGGGAASSYSVAQSAGLSTSFESSGLTYSLDFGVIPTLAYFGSLVSLALPSKGWGRAIKGSGVAFVVAFVVFNSYSGGSIPSSAASLLLLVTGLAASRGSERADEYSWAHRSEVGEGG